MGLPEDFLDKKHDDKCKFMGDKAKESKGKDKKANFGICGFCMDKWSQWENKVEDLKTGDIKKHCKEFKSKFDTELKEFTGKIMEMEGKRDEMKKGGKGEGKGEGKGDGKGEGKGEEKEEKKGKKGKGEKGEGKGKGEKGEGKGKGEKGGDKKPKKEEFVKKGGKGGKQGGEEGEGKPKKMDGGDFEKDAENMMKEHGFKEEDFENFKGEFEDMTEDDKKEFMAKMKKEFGGDDHDMSKGDIKMKKNEFVKKSKDGEKGGEKGEKDGEGKGKGKKD